MEGAESLQKVPQNTNEYFVWNVLDNLLENAVKFTPEGENIKVLIQENPHNPHLVDLLVTNDGTGFPTDILKSEGINDTYLNHLNNGRPVPSKMGTHNERGTGEGLSLCLEFARCADLETMGDLKYENRINEEGVIDGSIVTFSVPKK